MILSILRLQNRCQIISECLFTVLLALVVSGCTSLKYDSLGTYSNEGRLSQNGSLTFDALDKADNAYRQRDWFLAESAYRSVTQELPKDAYVWFRLGNSLTQLGRYKEAVDAYEQSLSINNDQYKSWFNLSTTHLLSAKLATLQSLQSLPTEDPSRGLAEQRLDVLTALLR